MGRGSEVLTYSSVSCKLVLSDELSGGIGGQSLAQIDQKSRFKFKITKKKKKKNIWIRYYTPNQVCIRSL